MKTLIVFLTVFCAASFLWAASDSRFEQGERFEAAGQYEKALVEYRAILAADPHNADAFYAAGSVRFKMKDYKGAVANYQLAYKFSPKMTKAYEASAKAYELLGDKANAEAERKKSPRNKVSTGDKTEAKAEVKGESLAKSDILSKAKAAFDSKDYRGACSAAREVLAKDPGNAGAYYYAGAGRYELGELDKAEYNLKRSFGYAELGFNAHYYLALIYKKQGKSDKEKAELEAYVKVSKNESAVANAKSRIAELSGPAQSVAPVIADETPKTAETVFATEKVAETVAKVDGPDSQPVEVNSVNPPIKPKKKTELSLESANDAYRQGDYASALSQYQDLQKKFRDENTRAYLLFQIGNVYRCRRDFRSAVGKYRELVEMYPNSDWTDEAQRAWEDAVWQEKNAAVLPRR